jgi:tetratricopeptide (TPR) repeat protein
MNQHSPSLIQTKKMEVQNLKAQSYQFLLIGKQHLLKKDYSQSIKSFTDCLKIDYGNQDAKFYLALSYLDSGLTKEATKELEDLKAFSPQYS